jgi:hypothetical protein
MMDLEKASITFGPGQLPYEMVPIKNQNKITEDQCDDARESDLLQDKKLDGD